MDGRCDFNVSRSSFEGIIFFFLQGEGGGGGGGWRQGLDD